MKKIILMTFFSFIAIANCFAQFGGGDGTDFNPYTIENATHLNNIRLYEVDHSGDTTYLYLDKSFIQVADIDLGVPPWNEDEGWEPIGTIAHPFTGHYDGNNQTIQNLTINKPSEDNIGLFGVINDGIPTDAMSNIYELILTDVSIVGNDNVGAFVGSFLSGSLFNSIWYLQRFIYSTGSVSGDNNVGGLIGYSDSSDIWRSYSTCSVNGYSYVGGLVGRLDNSNIGTCYSEAVVTSGYDYLGGLVGRAYESEISQCYVDCNLEMTGSGIGTGGVVGYLTDNARIQNCYSFGIIAGGGTTGGLAGYNHSSTITNCYSVCTITGSGGYVGGLVGRTDGTITHSYWDAEVSGIEGGAGSGRTTDEMTHPYAGNTYELWNFDTIWVQDAEVGFGYYNSGYPYLSWQNNPQQYGFAGGSGTEEDPYQISHANHLNSVRQHLEAYFIQIADVELGESPWNDDNGWEPVDTFSGNYDGGGYTISNLMIDRPGWDNENIGLFAATDGATIHNTHLISASINSYNQVGGLIGYNSGSSVTNCSVTGNITAENWNCGGLIGHNINSIVTSCNSAVIISGSTYVGGLIGNNENSTVEFCYSSGSVSDGDQSVGGLVGMNQNGSHINCCYSTVDVTALGSQNAGGLVGGNWQNAHIANSYAKGFVHTNSTYSGGFIGGNSTGCTVTNCFSTGEMTTLSASMGFLGQGNGTDSGCYWNTETSGHSLSGGTAEGRTTNEMTSIYAENTYVGWDFTTIWAADTDYEQNDGYPYLLNTVDNPLPITLSSFTVQYRLEHNYLTWKTESELDNSYWNIYRSPSENIGQAIKINPERIEGHGTTFVITHYSFMDNNNLIPLHSYWYWLESVDYSGKTSFYGPIKIKIPLSDNQEPPQIPILYGLFQNYPNPFNPSTAISFMLESSDYIKLEVCNIKGQLIKTLYECKIEGEKKYEIIWNGKDENEIEMPSGVYFYKLKSSHDSKIKKMIMVK